MSIRVKSHQKQNLNLYLTLCAQVTQPTHPKKTNVCLISLHRHLSERLFSIVLWCSLMKARVRVSTSHPMLSQGGTCLLTRSYFACGRR